jgi:hypothetical protein
MRLKGDTWRCVGKPETGGGAHARTQSQDKSRPDRRRPPRRGPRRRSGVAGSVLAATSVKAYVEPVGGEYDIKALFSVDDKLPLLGGAAGQQYRMVGIPDGLGAHPNSDGTRTLFMNHELGFTALSELVESSRPTRGTAAPRAPRRRGGGSGPPPARSGRESRPF